MDDTKDPALRVFSRSGEVKIHGGRTMTVEGVLAIRAVAIHPVKEEMR